MVTAAMNSVVGSPPKNPFDLDFELIFKHTQPISLALVSEVFLLVKDAIASAQIEQLEKLDLEAWSIPESARQRAIDYVRANSDYILWLDSVSAGSSRFGLKAKAIGLAFLALVGEKVVEKGVDEIVDSAKTQIVETINRRHAIPPTPTSCTIKADELPTGIRATVWPNSSTPAIDFISLPPQFVKPTEESSQESVSKASARTDDEVRLEKIKELKEQKRKQMQGKKTK
jgi:hypothetical protein